MNHTIIYIKLGRLLLITSPFQINLDFIFGHLFIHIKLFKFFIFIYYFMSMYLLLTVKYS